MTAAQRTEQVPKDEHDLAARLVEAWGYYREIDPVEVEHGLWFRYGPGLLWWMVGFEDGTVTQHICLHPRYRRRIYGRELLVQMRLAAQLVGATRIRIERPVPEAAEYLSRLGFAADGDTWYLPLPEPLEPLGVTDG